MVKLTLIARVADGLPLAEGLDGSPELDFYKAQAKVRGGKEMVVLRHTRREV